MPPPWARATARQTERPRPALRVPSGSVPEPLWKASKMRSFSESGMPGPSSATQSSTLAPERAAKTVTAQPAGVWATALLTRFTSACTTSDGSARTSRGPSGGSKRTGCAGSAAACRRASSTRSSTSSTSASGRTPPSSRRVTVRRFSTVSRSQRASSRIPASRRPRAASSSDGPASRRTSAVPAIEVSGVRRSCEMERRRSARVLWSRARTASSSRCSRASTRSSARATSPQTEPQRSRSSAERPAAGTTPATPCGHVAGPTGR